MHATCEHGYIECRGKRGGAYLNFKEVFGRPVQLLKGLLARIWYGLHIGCSVIVCTVVYRSVRRNASVG